MKPNTHIKQEMFIGRAQSEPDCFNGLLECSIRVFQFFKVLLAGHNQRYLGGLGTV